MSTRPSEIVVYVTLVLALVALGLGIYGVVKTASPPAPDGKEQEPPAPPGPVEPPPSKPVEPQLINFTQTANLSAGWVFGTRNDTWPVEYSGSTRFFNVVDEKLVCVKPGNYNVNFMVRAQPETKQYSSAARMLLKSVSPRKDTSYPPTQAVPPDPMLLTQVDFSVYQDWSFSAQTGCTLVDIQLGDQLLFAFLMSGNIPARAMTIFLQVWPV
jgi:hypothetical protein